MTRRTVSDRVASAHGAKTCDIYKDYGGNDRVALIRF